MSEIRAIVMLRALFALSLLAAACGPSTAALPPPATAHNAAGVRHLGAGDLDAAEARFRIALEYHPRFVEARANLGAVALERGELAEAERHLRLAVHLDPEFDEAWANLGVLHARRGELEAAAEALETALSIDPGLTDARRNLGDVWIRLGRFAEARAQLMRLVELHAAPSAPWARASGLLAYCELRLGRPTAARARAERVLQAHPEAAIARVVRGALHARAGRPRSALADLAAAARDPLVGFDARLRLAAVRLALGDVERAAPLIAALRRERPASPAVDLLGASLAAAREEWSEAARAARRALRRSPGLEAARGILERACEAAPAACRAPRT